MAHASDLQKAAQPSDIDSVKLSIDSINDPIIKEKLLDLNSIEYLELVVVDGKNALLNNKDAINECKYIAINEIEKLSKLDENQLDAVIENKMQDIIYMQKERTDIIIPILPLCVSTNRNESVLRVRLVFL